MHVIVEWDLANSMKCATTDNASDKVKSMWSSRIELNGWAHSEFLNPNSFHVRCMAHGINLDIKECMLEVRSKIEKTRYLLSAMCASVKPLDLFENVRKKLNLSC